MLTLERHPLITQVVDGHTMWLLEIHAKSSGENDSKIFVYHSAMNDDKFEGDVFEAVCSVQQITSLPPDEAVDFDDTRVIPYYRSSVMKHLLPDPAEAEALWLDIKEDVQELKEHLAALNFFFNSTSVTVDNGLLLDLDGAYLDLGAESYLVLE
jgi:hypothetical protein